MNLKETVDCFVKAYKEGFITEVTVNSAGMGVVFGDRLKNAGIVVNEIYRPGFGISKTVEGVVDNKIFEEGELLERNSKHIEEVEEISGMRDILANAEKKKGGN